MIGMNVFYIVAGMIFGGLLGYTMKLFNRCTCLSPRGLNWAKFFFMLGVAVSLPIICYYIEFEESKYIAIIFYGYSTF